MKKFFVIALAAMSLSMVSCKSAEEKKMEEYVEKISKAMDSQNIDEAAKIADEMKTWMAGLNEDQQKAIEKGLGKEGEAQLETMFQMIETAQGMSNQLEEATEQLEEAGAALDEAAEVIEEAAE